MTSSAASLTINLAGKAALVTNGSRGIGGSMTARPASPFTPIELMVIVAMNGFRTGMLLPGLATLR